jgi:hypothetical protein
MKKAGDKGKKGRFWHCDNAGFDAAFPLTPAFSPKGAREKHLAVVGY